MSEMYVVTTFHSRKGCVLAEQDLFESVKDAQQAIDLFWNGGTVYKLVPVCTSEPNTTEWRQL